VLRALPVLALSLASVGCLGLNFERDRDGSPVQVAKCGKLKPGRSTLHQVVEQVGPPDLLLRVGEVDRLYYAAWDSDYFKLIVELELPVPVAGRSMSWDVYVQTLGWEEFHLARLDFDRRGVLKETQTAVFKHGRNGRYFAIDNRFISQYLEDKSRALRLVETDDDEEDVEMDQR
jgi:hypothetical protein